MKTLHFSPIIYFTLTNICLLVEGDHWMQELRECVVELPCLADERVVEQVVR